MSLLSPLRSVNFSHGSEFYELSDEYDASVSGFTGTIEYYGYLNIAGGWIVVEHNISTGAWRYVQGANSYPAAWTAALAGSLTYGYYNTLFVTNP